MVELNRGFNLIKLQDMEVNNMVVNLSLDITSNINLDFNLVALDRQNNVKSDITVNKPYFWYNEISDTTNLSINFINEDV